jgi:hypothetical protein
MWHWPSPDLYTTSAFGFALQVLEVAKQHMRQVSRPVLGSDSVNATKQSEINLPLHFSLTHLQPIIITGIRLKFFLEEK